MGIPNKREATFGDGVTDYLNINTVDGRIELLNGAYISFYADAYTTLTGQIVNGAPAPQVSAAAAALASSGTVTTNVGVARLAPTAAVTAAIMGTGTRNGQECLVVNEAAPSNSVQFAASATSNVLDGTNDIIPGGQARLYVWDNSLTMWVAASPQLTNGTNFTLQSATAQALATSGTITTNGVGIARINPGSAVTAVVLGSGTIPGQQICVINEAAITNTITMAASGSSFVADGTNCIIPGLQARMFVWNGAQSLWFEEPINTNGALSDIPSATSPAVASSGTITTNGVGTARVTPAAAVTAIVLQAGILPGQEITVINESTTGANSVAMAASATSNVADGTSSVVSGLTCAKFKWDNFTSLWYHMK